MEMKRSLLYLIVAALSIVLWNTWIHDYPPQQPAATSQTASDAPIEAAVAEATQEGDYQPGLPAAEKPTSQPVSQERSLPLIQVKTDVLKLAIDPKGGNIVAAKLPQYPVSLTEKNTPVQIVNDSLGDSLYRVQNNIVGIKQGDIVFSSSQKRYILQPHQKTLVVELTGQTQTGLAVTKTYRFERNRYAIEVTQKITNQSGQVWKGSTYSQITRRQPLKKKGSFYAQAYDGGSVSSPAVLYQKMTYKEMNKADLNRSNPGGWVAMQQQYFVTAWVPSTQKATNHFYSHVVPSGDADKNSVYTLGFVGPAMTILTGASATSESTLYVGPAIVERLNRLNVPGLDHTVDYGWLWPISKIIFWIMNHFHQLLGNWGWSIIFTTVVIKIGFYWLSAQSFRSMARMRELQPRIVALRERFGDDRQALSRETMSLYRKEGVNPLGGCLPMLIQVPVFIGLYYMLMGSVELRQAPFVLWIHDLAAKDPYYVLPVLMGMSMFLQQRITPTAGDPMQQKVMMLLPLVFTVFFLHFPAGLVLYWLVNNCVQILQQSYVLKTYDAHKAKRHAKRQKRKKR